MLLKKGQQAEETLSVANAAAAADISASMGLSFAGIVSESWLQK